MKIIVAPDKFKGSLTSFEACSAITAGIGQSYSEAKVIGFPMADGGDGFASVLKHYTGSSDVVCKTCDPLGRGMEGVYQWNEKEKTAIIELAVASGLTLLDRQEQNPLYTSTYGTGLQIKEAVERGAEKIVLGLGGSATNDAGMGILEALGFQFLDAEDQWLGSCGRNLSLVDSIISPEQRPDIKFEIACDVQNVLHGVNGAAYVYAPQKGANEEEVKQLDEGLAHFASVIYKQTGKQVSDIPGTGAAGGIAAGLMGFFEVELKEGTKMIMEASGIVKELEGTDLLITGEGKIDTQTKNGKLINEISGLGNKYDIPVIAYCGISDMDKNGSKEIGLEAIFPIADMPSETDYAMKYAKDLLQTKVAATLPSIISGRS